MKQWPQMILLPYENLENYQKSQIIYYLIILLRLNHQSSLFDVSFNFLADDCIF